VPDFPNTALCVALSGGVDSTALLAALAHNRPRALELRALHVDHGLRPSSKQWAEHCRTLARRLRVPLQVLTTKVERSRGESLEAAAREARYRSLARALQPGEILLTAHHGDDQLETVLLQLFRGSGLRGIAAMPALAPFAQGWLARPLLSRSRAELEAWVRARGLTWVEDDTNVDESLDRNYLRRRVLPLIRDRWPGSPAAVARSARHAAEAQALLDSLARADVERASYGESLAVKTLRALPPERRRNALRFWIARAGWLAPDTRRLEEIAGPLLDARSDAHPFVEWGTADSGTSEHASPDVSRNVRGSTGRDADRPTRASTAGDTDGTGPGPTRASSGAASDPRARAQATTVSNARQRTRITNRVERHGDLLSLRSLSTPLDLVGAATPASKTPSPRQPQGSETATPAELVWSWRHSPTCILPGGLGKLELEPADRGPIDLDALPPALTIRWRSGGERLSPRRGGPSRALKNLLQEARVPAPERARLPLLFSVTPSGAKLIAVADLLLDETVQATPATRRRARLGWKKSSH
jgi:tRNA(Ile)-lysidine synthetase-like protein